MPTSDPNLFLSALAMYAVPRGIGAYLRQHLLDRTFQGLYHTDSFDRALLIPYFIVLVLLAGYGMHRYILVYLYYKHKKNRTTDPAAYFERLPRVTVQLPTFTEQYVVERAAGFDLQVESTLRRSSGYPGVLDDSRQTKTQYRRWRRETLSNGTPRWANPISYHHRVNREGFQSGCVGRRPENGKGGIRCHL